MADVSGKFFSAKKVRTGVSPSSPGVIEGETLPPLNPPGGGLNSVGLTMPSAFNVANSPLTSNGSLDVTGAGTTAQYIRGDGSLENFPSLTGYVPYTGANQTVNLNTQQLQAGHTTLTTNGSTETLTVNHTSGSGIGVNITKAGNNEGLRVNKTSGSGNAATIIGTLEATTLVKTGGTSSQFLKADGSVDSNVYALNSALANYQLLSAKGQPNGYAGLDSNGKVPLVQINDALIGNVNFQGLWNAATNTPTLANPPSAGTKGYYYIVDTAGTFAGISFEVGDWIISNGSAWGKVDNTDAVSSVFGRTGNVTAANGDYTTAQVTESGNLYYTDARSRAALSFAAGSGAYNSSTGVITIPTNNNQITNGAGYITSAALSGYLPLTGGTMTGPITTPNGTFGIVIGDDSRLADRNVANTLFIEGNQNSDRGYINFSETPGNVLGAINGGDLTWKGAIVLQVNNYNFYAPTLTGGGASGTWGIAITGNAATANTWTTARTITIGNTGKSVNGSANVAWSLAEIGAQAALTNPVTGTGTTNYLPKFTGSTTIGNSNLINDASGNLGLGVTPPSWNLFKAINIGGSSVAANGSSAIVLSRNWYYESGEKYFENGTAQRLELVANGFFFQTATTNSSGAGAALTWGSPMTLNNSGRLLLGTTDDNGARLQVSGEGRFKVSTDRNLAIKYDTNITISAQSDSGAPENIRHYADTFRIYTATTAAGLTERFTISNSGAATFSSSVTATGIINANSAATAANGSINIDNSDPTLRFRVTGGTANSRIYEWRAIAAGGVNDIMQLRLWNDAQNSVSTLMTVSSSGAINATSGYLGGGANFTNLGQASNSPSSTSANIGVLASAYAFIDLSTQHPDGGWIDFSKGDGSDYAGRIRYFNSIDQFRFYTSASGTSALSITSGGNVLIGTTTDSAGRLRVKASGNDAYAIAFERSNATTTIGGFYQNSGSSGEMFLNASNGSQNVKISSTQFSYWAAPGVNFAIGTSIDSTDKLRVAGNTYTNTIRTVRPDNDNRSVEWKLGTASGGTVTPNAVIRVSVDGVEINLVGRYV